MGSKRGVGKPRNSGTDECPPSRKGAVRSLRYQRSALVRVVAQVRATTNCRGLTAETAWGIGQRFPSDEVPSPKVMVTPINHGVASVWPLGNGVGKWGAHARTYFLLRKWVPFYFYQLDITNRAGLFLFLAGPPLILLLPHDNYITPLLSSQAPQMLNFCYNFITNLLHSASPCARRRDAYFYTPLY